MSATVIPFPARPDASRIADVGGEFRNREFEPLVAPGRVWVTAQFTRDGLRGMNLPGVESVEVTSRFPGP